MGGERKVYTCFPPERKALLLELRGQGRPYSEILPLLNTLPGVPIDSEAAVAVMYSRLTRKERLDQLQAAAGDSPSPDDCLAGPVPSAVPIVRYPMWSLEREEMMLSNKRLGLTWEQNRRMLNMLPGPQIATNRVLYGRFHYLQRKAAEAAKQNLQAAGAPELANAGPAAAVVSTATGNLDVSSLNSPPAAKQPGVPFVVVPYQAARKWACVQGLCNKYSGLNLRLVNAVRRREGLPVFALEGAL